MKSVALSIGGIIKKKSTENLPSPKNVLFVGSILPIMPEMNVSIVVESAIRRHVLRVVLKMSPENMKNELLYQSTMSIARKMLTDGFITKEEYGVIDTKFLEKYKPILGSLCAKMT